MLCTTACAASHAGRPRASDTRAEVALAQLDVKGRAPKSGYARARFGAAWADVDRNGCDTRNDVLNRDLTNKRWRVRTRECVVIEGDLADPYTDARLHFAKADASAVQIDHVVALSDAWQTGAASWDDGRRTRFANDPLNLLAVASESNQAKGSADAASWLPPSHAIRCAYVARQIAVKAKWQLWVTRAEHDAMARVLAPCPGQLLPR
jgi:hypothetical protein